MNRLVDEQQMSLKDLFATYLAAYKIFAARVHVWKMRGLRCEISRIDAMLNVEASGVSDYHSGEAQANEEKGLETVHG